MTSHKDNTDLKYGSVSVEDFRAVTGSVCKSRLPWGDVKSIKLFLESDSLHFITNIQSTNNSESDINNPALLESSCYVKNNAVSHRTYPTELPQWNFEDIYEDLDCDNSFYSQ